MGSSKEYLEENKESIKLRTKKYYETHKEEIKIRTDSYRKSHKDKVKEYSKKHYNKNKEAISLKKSEYNHRTKVDRNKKSKELYESYRDRFFDLYGSICECCGEKEKIFLNLDHVQGQVGIKNKEKGAKAYRNAVIEYNPNKYRVLCWNCNQAIRWGRSCPHQTQREYQQ